MHEHQHRQPVRHGLGEVGGAGRLEVVGLARRAHPAIKAGLAVELALDRAHQRPGADPADAELERGDALAFEFLARELDDRVARLAGNEREDLADQSAHDVADATSGRGVGDAQPVERDRSVVTQPIGMDASDRVAQSLRAGDQRAAVGQLEHHDLVGGRRVLVGRRTLGTAGGGAYIEGPGGTQVGRGQEFVVGAACGASGAGEQRRQDGFAGTAGELDRNGPGHRCLLVQARLRRALCGSLVPADRRGTGQAPKPLPVAPGADREVEKTRAPYRARAAGGGHGLRR